MPIKPNKSIKQALICNSLDEQINGDVLAADTDDSVGRALLGKRASEDLMEIALKISI